LKIKRRIFIMAELKTVKLIKGDNPVICSPERAQYYLDKGWELAGSKRRRTPVEIEDIVEEEPVQFTGGGLPRIEVIAEECGLEDVTGQERSVAMEDSNLGGL
jgi:hypothetical protein